MIMHVSINSAGKRAAGSQSPKIETTNPAVSRSFETWPSVTARPRMIAPTVMLLQPSRKPSIAVFRGIPLNVAMRMAEAVLAKKA